MPATLIALGVYGWACVDDPDLSDTGDDGKAGDTGGPDSGGEDTTAASTGGPTSAGSASTTGGSADVTARDVLESIALRVIVPTTASFQSTTGELRDVVAQYAAAVDENHLAAGVELAAAQDAWQAAMGVWQRLEVMQIGPAAPASSAIAGGNMRDEIYSWPTVDTCSVDRRLVAEDYENPDFFVTQLVMAYGLDAL